MCLICDLYKEKKNSNFINPTCRVKQNLPSASENTNKIFSVVSKNG